MEKLINRYSQLTARLLAAAASHAAYLLAAALLVNSIGLAAAIFSFVPAVVTAFLFGLMPGLTASFLIVFIETPLVASWTGLGYFESLIRTDNIPGALSIFAITAVVGYLHDLRSNLKAALDKQIKSEIKLAEANRQMKKKNQDIINFTNMLTHDLKNPLSGIKGVFQMLKLDVAQKVNEDTRETIEIGAETADYMQELLNDLLDVARLETGTKKLEKKAINIQDIVDKVIVRLKLQGREKDVSFHANANVTLAADESAFSKVFMNLIGNAVAYMDDKPVHEVSIAATQNNGVVNISVQDNGMGIPEENQAEVFEKFKRGSNTSEKKGTGLGLAICKAIVVAHDGTIWLESKEGVGTTFHIEVPSAAQKDIV